LAITASGYFNIINKTINYEPALQALSAITCCDNVSFYWVGFTFLEVSSMGVPADRGGQAFRSAQALGALGPACTEAPDWPVSASNLTRIDTPSLLCKEVVLRIFLFKIPSFRAA
jgi:hypothetical protein